MLRTRQLRLRTQSVATWTDNCSRRGRTFRSRWSTSRLAWWWLACRGWPGSAPARPPIGTAFDRRTTREHFLELPDEHVRDGTLQLAWCVPSVESGPSPTDPVVLLPAANWQRITRWPTSRALNRLPAQNCRWRSSSAIEQVERIGDRPVLGQFLDAAFQLRRGHPFKFRPFDHPVTLPIGHRDFLVRPQSGQHAWFAACFALAGPFYAGIFVCSDLLFNCHLQTRTRDAGRFYLRGSWGRRARCTPINPPLNPGVVESHLPPCRQQLLLPPEQNEHPASPQPTSSGLTPTVWIGHRTSRPCSLLQPEHSRRGLLRLFRDAALLAFELPQIVSPQFLRHKRTELPLDRHGVAGDRRRFSAFAKPDCGASDTSAAPARPGWGGDPDPAGPKSGCC